MDADRVLLTSLTLAEMLQGTRSEGEFDGLYDLFRDVPRIVESEEDWVGAARLTSSLRRNGVRIPLFDCCLATVCLRHEVLLLTLDGDFDRVPGLRRMKPEPRA
jgi:predicted nucleic acid-binding protein